MRDRGSWQIFCLIIDMSVFILFTIKDIMVVRWRQLARFLFVFDIVYHNGEYGAAIEV